MISVVVAGSLAGNLGAIEVVGVPDGTHLGVYPYLGASYVIPAGDDVALIPGLSIEWSPDQSRWGFVATGTADLALSPRFGIDLNVGLIHDQSGTAFGDADFFLGIGPGMSIFLGRYTVSPYVSVFKGLNVSGWSLVPGVNAAIGFVSRSVAIRSRSRARATCFNGFGVPRFA